MLSRIFLTILLSSTLAMTGCGKEGPFGDTPRPKKPIWNYDLGGFQE